MAPSTDDPRINDDYVRTLPTENGDVTLVGVVHDHPASVHRVRTLVETRAPDAVALELSPLALPLFEAYAEDEKTPPELGGEMSAAIQAADCDVVGIDAPSLSFLRRLFGRIREERPERDTVARVLRGVASVTKHALTCRIGASIARWTGRTVELDRPVDHECTLRDAPTAQAEDERKQASQSLSLLRAFETPEPMHLRDATREECMAARLRELSADGNVVAVVGIDHLDGVSGEFTA
ncbi:hypothetical protein G9464_13040 [Halostella sp. JP-L12]|uniref:hypothetical protein n=1 Tax=Halostella TaxID=1843185 RepID=UPI000EF82873|nr:MULTISPECIES: hypothetical protein [Halostella]NHN48511.1 hypothetical protein [Halostella sp. JP-L12]